MIIKIKKGFSLAELLIALAIVSVIATMGFSISKKGVENAYNLYIYTGYVGLADAISDATDSGLSHSSVNNWPSEFIQRINDDLSGTISSVDSGNQSLLITAPNKISYMIKYSLIQQSDDDTLPLYNIDMTIPSAKKRGASNRMFKFTYSPLIMDGLLIPSDIANGSSYENIADNKLLLPFYIDDGVVGRVINGSYQKRTFYSAREAICKSNGAVAYSVSNSDTPVTILTCSNINKDSIGVVRVINPRKI